MHRHYRSLRTVTSFYIILPLLLIVVLVSNVAGQKRKKVEISGIIQPSPVVAPRYFRVHGRFGGGVTPRGYAEFLSPVQTQLDASQLQFVILDRAKLRNNVPDYDALGIRWNGQVYQLAAQDDLIYPLMKFIQRGNYIAYTVPIVAFDEEYFRDNGLVEEPGGGGYVAQEFNSAAHANFLAEVDLGTEVEDLDAKFKKIIMGDLAVARDPERRGSYVNADFNVKYKVFLNISDGKKVVDVGGLPLRYSYQCRDDECESTEIVDIEVFTFPEEEFSLQDRAVMFFQTAAILRQFSESNKAEFNRLLRQVSPVGRGRNPMPSQRRRRAPGRR